MKSRDACLIELRQEKFGTSNSSLKEEIFQNNTLRPILKFQNELFIAVFINYAQKQKGQFFLHSPEKKLLYIENAIQKDIKFRNALKGIIIGLFTTEEYLEYIQNSSSLNKRMMNLLIERLKSQVQLLVP